MANQAASPYPDRPADQPGGGDRAGRPAWPTHRRRPRRGLDRRRPARGGAGGTDRHAHQPGGGDVPVGSQPTRLAVTDDAVWVTSLVGGTVTRIDPRTNQVVATIRTGGRPVHVAADDRSVWVAYPLDTLVKRIDPRTNTGGGVAQGRPAPGGGPRVRLGLGAQPARPRGPPDRPPDRAPDGRRRRQDPGGRGAGVPRGRDRRGLGREHRPDTPADRPRDRQGDGHLPGRRGPARHGGRRGVAVDRGPGRRHGLAGAAPRQGATTSSK